MGVLQHYQSGLTLWINPYRELPLRGFNWIKMPKRQFPANSQLQENSSKSTDRTSPPLARPLYVPAPAAPARTSDNDFADLPGEEIDSFRTDTTIAQSKSTKHAEPAKRDALEGLINQVT
jgi:penicillin-binding protein 1A